LVFNDHLDTVKAWEASFKLDFGVFNR